MSHAGEVRSIGNGKYVPVTDNPDNRDNPDDRHGDPELQRHTSSPAVTGVTEVTEAGAADAGAPSSFVETVAKLQDAVAAVQRAETVAVDLETTGLNPRTDRARLISLTTPEGTWLVDCFAVDPEPLFPVLSEKRLVFHNASFDLGFLYQMGFELAEEGEVLDTMLVSQLLEDTEAVGTDEHGRAA